MEFGIADLTSLGATGILAVVVILFVRGEILSRLVYEKLTEQIVARVVGEISSRILAGMTEMLHEWEDQRLAVEVERLKQERDRLAEELGRGKKDGK